MRIKEIMKAKRGTVTELAQKLNISRQGLYKQLNGRMLVGTAEKIASALNVPVWQLFVSPDDVMEPVVPNEKDFLAIIKMGKVAYSASTISEAFEILKHINSQLKITNNENIE